MINPNKFVEEICRLGVNFFTGVPDSLLKNLTKAIENKAKSSDLRHLISANEGTAFATAAGFYLGTNNIPVVYLQNSGLGNIVNPVLSLSHSKVYSIPLIIIIGWRGEPGLKDEPQHLVQGSKTQEMLDLLDIHYEILNTEKDGYISQLSSLYKKAKDESKPVALLIKKDSFIESIGNKQFVKNPTSFLIREKAIKTIISNDSEKKVYIATTGMISRELYEIRESKNQSHQKDFLTVGSMGHASSIALGFAISNPKKEVYCLDGDGAFLMHMGSSAIIASLKQKNFKHILLNNFMHDSVGGQPTCASNFEPMKIAEILGYDYCFSVNEEIKLKNLLLEIDNLEGLCFIEIKLLPGKRSELGRPKETPLQCKNNFIYYGKNH